MELLQLRYFCTAARLQNISRAAACHSIPQPDMSKTISKLEKELGTQLFSRERNKIALTETGKQFYTRISAALEQIDQAVAIAQVRPGNAPEELHLLVNVLRSKFAQWLTVFHQQHPDVLIKVAHTSDVQYTQQLFDLCITGSPPTEDYDCALPLLSQNLTPYIALSHSHPLAAKQVIEPEELAGVPFVTTSITPLIKTLIAQFESRGIQLNIPISCDDIYFLRQYITAGIAVAFTFSYSWQELSDPDIRFVKVNTQIPVHFCLYWSSKKPRSKAWFSLVSQIQSFFDPAMPFWTSEPPLT